MITVTPLTKRTLDGEIYTRDAKLESKLIELASLSRDDIVTRCTIRRRDDPGYVPSECVLYFLRATRTDTSEIYFSQLYKVLAERVLRKLPKAESLDGTTLSSKESQIRERAFDRFISMLIEDRAVCSESLDYFELRFDGAVANLRRDASTQVWRDENRFTGLETDEETGELSPEIERAAGSYDPYDVSDLDDIRYRLRLDAAIDTLPPLQRRIVEMLRQEIPIDSKDTGAVTIAKTLGKSEKTIRTHRDKAYAALRAALTVGEKP